jgi:UDP-GlcNAc3NAcA epimerase
VLEHEPDGVLVYGDTNSTLAAVLVACKVAYRDGRRPWIAHVEAGLRSLNSAMPEERNRIVADHLSDLLLAPTPVAMEHLQREGLSDRAELVGDVMVDAFQWAASRADGRPPLPVQRQPGYLLATLHRPENVDDPSRLALWLDALEMARPVIFPIHPRTRETLARIGRQLPSNITAIDPVGYLEMVSLEQHAIAIATDSGGMQKEAYLAGVPCITLRSETEWVETVAAGWNRLVGDDPSGLRRALDDAAFMDRSRPRPDLYGDGNAAGRIVAALERLNQRRVGRGTSEREPQPTEAAAS